MSTSPSVSCPEPLPYSDDVSGYADIDFTVAAPRVYSMQPNMVQVDSILSNQLGPTSNPMQAPSSSYMPGFPELAPVGENSAKPLLSSYMGAEISGPTTLSSTTPNFMSVNDIVGNPTSQPTAVPVEQQFTNVPEYQQPEYQQPEYQQPEYQQPEYQQPVQQKREHFSPRDANARETINYINGRHNRNVRETINNVSDRREHFGSQVKPRFGPQPKPKNNLATFINKNTNKPSIEHFNPKKIEHFQNLTMMDNIVLGIVIAAFIYYIYSLKYGNIDIDLSKIPILSQLSDNNVSMENKIIIVLAVVIACVLISRMLK